MGEPFLAGPEGGVPVSLVEKESKDSTSEENGHCNANCGKQANNTPKDFSLEEHNHASHKKKQKWHARIVQEYLALTLIIAFNGYLLYAYAYLAVWHRIRYRNRGAAITMLVLLSVLNFHMYLGLAAVHWWGPGRITEKYTKNTDDNDAFLCDAQGYSLYCSQCQRIKPNWTHHSGQLNRCIPMMDHFCPWVAAWIGQGNIKFFLQFLWSALMALILILVTLLIYEHQQYPHINGNFIAMYITVPLFIMFVGSLVSQYVLYVAQCHTLIESMSVRKGTLPHVNIPYQGERRVVHPLKKDIFFPHSSMFSHGVWKNISTTLGPIYTWTLPWRPEIHEPQFNRKFVEKMQKRVDAELKDSDREETQSAVTEVEKVAGICLERQLCGFCA